MYDRVVCVALRPIGIVELRPMFIQLGICLEPLHQVGVGNETAAKSGCIDQSALDLVFCLLGRVRSSRHDHSRVGRANCLTEGVTHRFATGPVRLGQV